MSHSIPAPPVTQDPALTDAATRAIQLALHPRSPESDGHLREAMQGLCGEGRRRGIHPEELIILFKKAWASHPKRQALSREEGNAALDHLITMCIKEYYDGPG